MLFIACWRPISGLHIATICKIEGRCFASSPSAPTPAPPLVLLLFSSCPPPYSPPSPASPVRTRFFPTLFTRCSPALFCALRAPSSSVAFLSLCCTQAFHAYYSILRRQWLHRRPTSARRAAVVALRRTDRRPWVFEIAFVSISARHYLSTEYQPPPISSFPSFLIRLEAFLLNRVFW